MASLSSKMIYLFSIIKKVTIIVAFLFLSSAHSKVLEMSVFGSKKQEFSFKEVCESGGVLETPLISVIDTNTLDCMGKKIRVSAFCEKKLLDDDSYLRAVIEEKSKTIFCQSGSRVVFKYDCSGLSNSYCNDAKSGCTTVQESQAKKLKLVYFALTKPEKNKKHLTCFFEQEIKPKAPFRPKYFPGVLSSDKNP